VGFVVAATAHFVFSSVVVFATTEHLISASKIGGVAFTLASAVGSSMVA
jgi:hypothetical protein